MPGGEGVTNSFSSPETTATTPSKGAESRVLASPARATATLAAPTRAVAWAASQSARADLAPVVARSRASSEASLRALILTWRSASRSALSALRQAARALASPASASRSASDTWALRSWFQSSSSRSPCLTRWPSRTASVAIWPPTLGARRARRQACTVPARVLATVSSTTPSWAACTFTATGSASRSQSQTAAAAAALARSRARRAMGRIGLSLGWARRAL